jgi:hypothetical protein
MNRKFAVYGLVVFLGGCGHSYSLLAPSSVTEQKSAYNCQDSPENQAKFQWTWCASNQVSSSEIGTVCYGELFYEDMIFRTIKLRPTRGGADHCLILAGGGSEDTVTAVGCTRNTITNYESDTGQVPVNACYDSDGLTIGFSNVSGSRLDFKASK